MMGMVMVMVCGIDKKVMMMMHLDTAGEENEKTSRDALGCQRSPKGKSPENLHIFRTMAIMATKRRESFFDNDDKSINWYIKKATRNQRKSKHHGDNEEEKMMIVMAAMMMIIVISPIVHDEHWDENVAPLHKEMCPVCYLKEPENNLNKHKLLHFERNENRNSHRVQSIKDISVTKI